MNTTQKQTLVEERGFRYEVATEEFADAIVAVLSESFCREPMSAALGLSARGLERVVLAAGYCAATKCNAWSVSCEDTYTQ